MGTSAHRQVLDSASNLLHVKSHVPVPIRPVPDAPSWGTPSGPDPCGNTQRRSAASTHPLKQDGIMFHMYDGYHFWGMHLLWWFFWFAFIAVVFGAYEPVRRNRRSSDS